jgi:glutathione-regulated potassium-efflux system ancillary protein KefG
MSKVLLVVGHPGLSQSRANATLVGAVRDLTHVTVHDLYAAYPDFQIDVAAEQALLAEHDVIVFQHPVFWYNTTPLFKQWQDKVLRMVGLTGTRPCGCVSSTFSRWSRCTARLSASPTRS